MSETRIKLVMPTPYPLQREIAKHSAKYKVICAGRRGGKTTMAARMAVGGDKPNGFDNGLLDGKSVLLSSTSQDQADVFWEYIKRWLSPLLDANLIYKNEVKRILRFNDGQIRVKTGSQPDVLRGSGVSLLVLDECAYLHPSAWQSVGAPMLADSDGSAVFISTPKRRNWFFHLYQQAIQADNTDWQAWNFPSHANPHLPKSALERLAENMTDDDYRQEILAEFLEGSGAVFRNVDEVCILPEKLRATYPGTFVMGVDWAMTKDYTAITVMDVNTARLVDYDHFRGVDWSLQRGRLKVMYDKWKPITIVAESNSIGSPNIEALQYEGLPVVGFETTAVSKPPLIESLVLAFERRELELVRDPELMGELMAYERKVGATGRSQYSAPEGLHDDYVMSLALCWYARLNHAPTWLPVLA